MQPPSGWIQIDRMMILPLGFPCAKCQQGSHDHQTTTSVHCDTNQPLVYGEVGKVFLPLSQTPAA